MNKSIFNPSLRVAAWLLLSGQLLYIAVTQFHTGGEANNHQKIFAAYAASSDWVGVHVGQFIAMALFLGGLFALYFALGIKDRAAGWASRFGAVMAAAALPLYGALQAVDGVANKQADMAWVNAADGATEAAYFAGAEMLRWIEWGLRSYQNYAVGFALLMFAFALTRMKVSLAVPFLMALTGIAYLAQGWIVGVEGFSSAMSTAIVLSWVLGLAWIIWLLTISLRAQVSKG